MLELRKSNRFQRQKNVFINFFSLSILYLQIHRINHLLNGKLNFKEEKMWRYLTLKNKLIFHIIINFILNLFKCLNNVSTSVSYVHI
jgi:hypothetical protein